MPKHKAWIKPKVIIIDIGKCKYCHQEMTNQESFVAFYPKGKNKKYSKKQMKIARMAAPFDRITGADFAKLKKKKKRKV